MAFLHTYLISNLLFIYEPEYVINILNPNEPKIIINNWLLEMVLFKIVFIIFIVLYTTINLTRTKMWCII